MPNVTRAGGIGCLTGWDGVTGLGGMSWDGALKLDPVALGFMIFELSR